MKAKLSVYLLLIIPIAGTLVRTVPPPRPPTLIKNNVRGAHQAPLKAQLTICRNLFLQGNFDEAATLAQKGYRDGIAAGEPQIAARFLNNLGSCKFALHQFEQALATFLEARKLAESAGDNTTAGILDFNISSLYAHLGQMDAASAAVNRAMARLRGPERIQQLPGLLIHLAALQADQGRIPQALELYKQGISAADRAGDQDMYAGAWNDLGYVYLEHNFLPQAEHALLEAYRLPKLNRTAQTEGCYRNLGMLRLEQGDTRAAALLLERAVALSTQPGAIIPDWEVYYARGRVRLQQGDLQSALEDLRKSARLARTWRRGAFPDDATRVSAENIIQKVHTALVEAGNRMYFTTRQREFAQETFESAEANRSASLRAVLAESRDWRRNLPAAYWETLQRLESAEAELPGMPEASSGPVKERVQQLQGALIEWESRAGSNSDVELPGLLERTRRSLHADAALLAFHLATPNSYLWAVSREGFALYRLPPGPEIAARVAAFTGSMRQGGAGVEAAGNEIFQTLFGQVEAQFRSKPRWLLALDAQLFELPFAMLREESRKGGFEFLAERHSLQIVSGAAMLASSGQGSPASGPFLGIADPVYNLADPRWDGPRPSSFLGFFTARAGDSASDGDLHLPRLAGSAREVRECAAAWGGVRQPILLTGESAARNRIRSALNDRPAVVHFATHVLHSGQRGLAGLIALSLNRSGKQEVVGPAEIATWNLDGTLVALSGCSSGTADTLPATGLMGLTRACQASGARAVVASRWPTPDDSGALFQSFYGYLRTDPQAGPAVALQHAQIDMLHSGTWRSDPLYWGAYFVTGSQP